MNPELQQQAASFLEATKQAGSNAAQFLQEQAPQYANEVLAWHFWSGAIQFTLSALSLIACALVFKWAKNKLKDCSFSDEMAYECAIFATTLAATIAIAFGSVGIFAAAKAKIAPRAVIVEHAARLIGK